MSAFSSSRGRYAYLIGSTLGQFYIALPPEFISSLYAQNMKLNFYGSGALSYFGNWPKRQFGHNSILGTHRVMRTLQENIEFINTYSVLNVLMRRFVLICGSFFLFLAL